MPVRLFQLDSERKKIFDDDFAKLVENKRNEKVKRCVRSLANVYSSWNIVDDNRVTLLHLAAQYDNVELINFLVRSGCNVNVRNCDGETPLLTALCFKCKTAIEALLDANADISANEDVEQVLELMIREKDSENLSASILISFMAQLKSYFESFEMMADVLVYVKCPLLFVVYANDAQLTRMMLKVANYKIDDLDAAAALEHVMRSIDLENLRVLWQSNRVLESRDSFLSHLQSSPKSNHWEYMKILLQRLTDWAWELDYNFSRFLFEIFKKSDKQQLKMLLQECGIDMQLWQYYKFDPLPLLLQNRNLDSADVIELKGSRTIDVNVKAGGGMSALHFAAFDKMNDRVRCLLGLGADCNIKNDRQMVPLVYTSNSECVELLLLGGADLHTTDAKGRTVIEYWFDGKRRFKGRLRIVELILSQLMIDCYFGVKVKQTVLDTINRRKAYRAFYDKCSQQFNDLLNLEFLPSVQWSTLITPKAEIMARYMHNRDAVEEVKKWVDNRQFPHRYLPLWMKKYAEKAHRRYRARCWLATAISKITSNPFSCDHLVIERLCGFLSDQDVFNVAMSM